MALFYKISNLLKCKQKYYNYCKSSIGDITLKKNHESYISCNRYNNIQKEVSERFSNPPKITNKCISRYNELQHDKSIKKIITWNVQELWWYCYKGNKINNIINYIVNSDADVICLQEVFEPRSIWKIVNNNAVFSKYPHFLTGNMRNRFFIGENSGILVLSKKPIIFHQFTPFLYSKCPDSYASKGALYFSIDEYNFITTHLQSERPTLAASQLEYILRKSPFNNKTILLGDLNFENPFSLLNQAPNNIFHTHNSNRMLDHIISVNKDIDLTTFVDHINLKNVSDHFPVHGEICSI